ncbi:MAG: hypothetical protein II837_02420 [Treponema sp.]|nr:hypothetical protein [Treponema sp.]
MEVFKKMDKLYFSNRKKYDSFGILLGQMSPEIFSNSYSADSSWFFQFSQNMNAKNKKTTTIKDGLDVMYNMLQAYNHSPYNIKSFLDDYKSLYQ